MGARAIGPMGHVRMMAACQPFLSGAISKTVNLPETATVEDIAEVYLQGWKLGLKALAVYRDNCKVGQPLSDAKADKKDQPVDTTAPAVTVEKVIEYRPVSYTHLDVYKRQSFRSASTSSWPSSSATSWATAVCTPRGSGSVSPTPTPM